MTVSYKRQQVGNVDVFYREAGRRGAPVLLLLHGFPSSSHMFRDLIPLLEDRFHVIAPDLPGFGQTQAPGRGDFDYTFDSFATVISGFTEALDLQRYVLYVFDYGAPVGYRLATANPERVQAIISQNGNAYLDGFSDGWTDWEAYWRDPTPENRELCRAALSADVIENWQYRTGTSRQRLSPDGYLLDIMLMARPGAQEIQLDLILDYRSNIERYPEFQAYFRTHQPPFLAVWGRHDPAFIPAGAEAYKRDLPDAEVHFLDTGHFALETHAAEISQFIRSFLQRHI
ncbi:alpha/beta hydrolase [Rhizobium sp. AN80A]|uniref:alpha/beta fold hydrolase n=1 Tax=Rhizobium sp. AN80A TaxID=3040673 RepID=UPI0024B32F97|nr:alpha/beta hydrolase [Rhizobium sp. AN80A]